MLIHECVNCEKVSINRIAGDDDTEAILQVFKESQKLSAEKKNRLEHDNIEVYSQEMREEFFTQLFGKDFKKT